MNSVYTCIRLKNEVGTWKSINSTTCLRREIRWLLYGKSGAVGRDSVVSVTACWDHSNLQLKLPLISLTVKDPASQG